MIIGAFLYLRAKTVIEFQTTLPFGGLDQLCSVYTNLSDTAFKSRDI